MPVNIRAFCIECERNRDMLPVGPRVRYSLGSKVNLRCKHCGHEQIKVVGAQNA